MTCDLNINQGVRPRQRISWGIEEVRGAGDSPEGN